MPAHHAHWKKKKKGKKTHHLDRVLVDFVPQTERKSEVVACTVGVFKRWLPLFCGVCLLHV
jgi:hypothetical protein